MQRTAAHCPRSRGVAQVVLANPKTAGVARWIFLALWGSQQSTGWKRGHINNQQALDYVRAVFANVVVQPRDAREASDVFYKQKARRRRAGWVVL